MDQQPFCSLTIWQEFNGMVSLINPNLIGDFHSLQVMRQGVHRGSRAAPLSQPRVESSDYFNSLWQIPEVE
jgi:hypothetical protein